MNGSGRRELLLVMSMVGGILAVAMPVHADVTARVRLRGFTIVDTTVGGSGVLTAQHDDVATLNYSGYSLTTGGDVTSDATRGSLEGQSFSSLEILDTISRTTGFAEMYVFQADTYTVGAGTTGLATGAPVQVRIEARFNGRFVQEGRPSGSGEMLFNVVGVPGVAGRWVDWGTGGLNPPQDIQVDESWTIIADTTVGASFVLTSRLESTFNGTAFDGPTTGANTATGAALVRVSPGPGFSGLAITSEAGAPTTALPQVPLLSPIGIAVLCAALLAMVSLAIYRGRQYPA